MSANREEIEVSVREIRAVRLEALMLATESIYTSLFVQTRPGSRADLTGKLRACRVRRHPQRRVAFTAKWSRIPDLVPVAHRPTEAVDRLVPGSRTTAHASPSHGKLQERASTRQPLR